MDASTEQDRRYLQQMAEAAMDHKAAKILMANLAPADWDAMAPKDDIEAAKSAINAQTNARIAQHTLVIVTANVATLIALAGIIIGVAQIRR